MSTQTTLVLFKPDAIEKNITGTVLAKFQGLGLSIQGIKMMQLDSAILKEHYAHVADKPFFPEIESFMSQSPVIAVALKGHNAITAVRDLLGPTNSSEAPAETIRGDYGETMMINVCHASDSEEAASDELARFFKPEELFNL